MKLRSLLISLASCLLFTQCSHYANTKLKTSAASVGYGTNYRVVVEKKKIKMGSYGAGFTTATAAAYIVGYIFTQTDKEITKARTGDYGHANVTLTNTSQFPEGGYLVVVRTIQDPKNEFPGIAGTEDFITRRENTAGAQLHAQIVKSSKLDSGGTLSAFGLSKALSDALDNAPDGRKIQSTDKIAMLAVCPIIKLNNLPSGAEKLYGVGLTGVYFPILSASRFGLESTSLSKRITQSREALVIEVRGPNGSGYTTGQIAVPLVWNPPAKGERADWVSSKQIFEQLYSKDEREQLNQLVVDDALKRISNGDAFVAPRDGIRPILRANFKVTETSKATNWISKGVGKIGDVTEGKVSGE
jgi:hypothetical protein